MSKDYYLLCNFSVHPPKLSPSFWQITTTRINHVEGKIYFRYHLGILRQHRATRSNDAQCFRSQNKSRLKFHAMSLFIFSNWRNIRQIDLKVFSFRVRFKVWQMSFVFLHFGFSRISRNSSRTRTKNKATKEIRIADHISWDFEHKYCQIVWMLNKFS